MLKRTTNSLHTILHTCDFPACSNRNALRNISQRAPETGTYLQNANNKTKNDCNNVQNNFQEIIYLNKESILESVAILLPIKKDPLLSQLYVSNVQSLTSHNAKSSTTAPTEFADSTSMKSTVLEKKKPKEKEVVQQEAISNNHNVQNSQNSIDHVK